MRTLVREHVRLTTAALTALSLALIFGAVLGLLPSLPRAPDAALSAIPTANALISLAAIGTISWGWFAIRRGDVDRHRRLMLVSLGLFAAFLGLYLYRITLLGPTEFGGPAVVYRYVYLPLLVVHVLLAIGCIPLLYYVALLGVTRPPEAIPATRHRSVGRVAAPLWVTAFALGVLVYALLYVTY